MSQVKLTLRPNGPLMIEGPFELIDHAGQKVTLDPNKSAYFLCRCGLSKNKPFCDGTHKRDGWCDHVSPPPNHEPKPASTS